MGLITPKNMHEKQKGKKKLKSETHTKRFRDEDRNRYNCVMSVIWAIRAKKHKREKKFEV